MTNDKLDRAFKRLERKRDEESREEEQRMARSHLVAEVTRVLHAAEDFAHFGPTDSYEAWAETWKAVAVVLRDKLELGRTSEIAVADEPGTRAVQLVFDELMQGRIRRSLPERLRQLIQRLGQDGQRARSFFSWLESALRRKGAFDRVDGQDSRGNTRIPDPSPEAILEAMESLKARDSEERLQPAEVIELYGLHVEVGVFNKSRFVSSTIGEGQPHQLPRGDVQRTQGASGKYVSGQSWSVSEVRAALRGWADRLDIDLLEGDGPF